MVSERPLGEIADILPRQPLLAHEIMPEYLSFPCSRRKYPAKHSEQCGLSSAVRADQAEHLPAVDRKVNSIHGNDSAEPMVWLDGLDIPIVRLVNASFAEPGAADTQPVTRPEGDSLARYGNNLLPVDWKPQVKTSPVFNYPYARSREALDALREEARRAQSGHLPRLSLIASAGRSESDTLTTFKQSARTSSVGVQLSVPLYAGGAVSAQARQAAAREAQAQAELDARTQAVMTEVDKSHACFS